MEPILPLCSHSWSPYTGIIGVLTVGTTPSETYADMQRVLSFIGQRQREVAEAATGQSSLTAAASPHRGSPAMLSSGRDLAPYTDIQLLVKFMAERSVEIALMTTTTHRQQQQQLHHSK